MEDIKKAGIDIEISPEVVRGNYSNLAIISHSSTEFVIDFAAMLPGMPKAKVCSRIILTPEHAKRLLRSLQDNLTRYESTYGKINLQEVLPQQGFKIGEA